MVGRLLPRAAGLEVVLGQKWLLQKNIGQMPPGVLLFKTLTNRDAQAMRAAHRQGWQTDTFVLYGLYFNAQIAIAFDLDARLGDTVSLEYFVWTDDGGLDTRRATFALQGIAPMMRVGGDRSLTPDYPGITDASDLVSWDPPFPVDLSVIRPRDEAYWDQWRAAPKAFVPLEVGQRLWGSRFGRVSSIRFALRDADAVTAAVRSAVSDQVAVRAVRAEALASAAGTTDFGQYFLYFSAFLVASALLITYLFFQLGVEQRAREVGILGALGFTESDLARASRLSSPRINDPSNDTNGCSRRADASWI